MACFSYIEGCYNPVRLHSALGYRSPWPTGPACKQQKPTRSAQVHKPPTRSRQPHPRLTEALFKPSCPQPTNALAACRIEVFCAIILRRRSVRERLILAEKCQTLLILRKPNYSGFNPTAC